MKPGCTLFFLLCSALTVTTEAHAQTPDTATTAPYLLAGAPTFDLSISQFREDFNSQNPSLPLNEFRAIDSSPDKANLTRAASKINENLYASTACADHRCHVFLSFRFRGFLLWPLDG